MRFRRIRTECRPTDRRVSRTVRDRPAFRDAAEPFLQRAVPASFQGSSGWNRAGCLGILRRPNPSPADRYAVRYNRLSPGPGHRVRASPSAELRSARLSRRRREDVRFPGEDLRSERAERDAAALKIEPKHQSAGGIEVVFQLVRFEQGGNHQAIRVMGQAISNAEGHHGIHHRPAALGRIPQPSILSILERVSWKIRTTSCAQMRPWLSLARSEYMIV